MDSIMKLFLLLTVISTVSCDSHQEVETTVASVTWTRENGFRLLEGTHSKSEDTVAWGNFTNAVNKTGWSFLEINSNEKFPDKVQAFAAGFLEGQLTSDLIFYHWKNTVEHYCTGKVKLCQKVMQFLQKNKAWVRKKLRRHRAHNAYWHQVALFYDQFEGIVNGYNVKVQNTGRGQHLQSGDIFWMNVFGDLLDFEQLFSEKLNITNPVIPGQGSCSALIKVMPNNSDIYASHVAWYYLESMLRMQKKYNFGYHFTQKAKNRKLVPGHSVAFSGYPGIIYSADDFHLLSSGLATIETSIQNANPDLWKFVKPTGGILEGVRVTVANRLARNGKQWTHFFSLKNSGTYNNQWMVLDYKKFTPGKPLPDGLFYVLEQMPGTIHAEDMTDTLRTKSFWSSYNIPYFKDIYNISNQPQMVEKYGNFFSFEKSPRAVIFNREEKKITDVDSMIRVMRFNRYKEESPDLCKGCDPPYSATNGISARNDLNPINGTFPVPFQAHNNIVGTDMKLTTFELFQKQQFIGIAGPTYDDQPAFQWSTSQFQDRPHYGHPDLWKFPPVKHEWTLP